DSRSVTGRTRPDDHQLSISHVKGFLFLLAVADASRRVARNDFIPITVRCRRLFRTLCEPGRTGDPAGSNTVLDAIVPGSGRARAGHGSSSSEDDGTDRGLVPALALRQIGDPEDQFVGGDVLIEFDGGAFIGVEDSLADDLGVLRVVPVADLELASGVGGLDLDLADGRFILELDEQTDTGFEVAELRRVVAIGVPRTLGLRNHVLGFAVVLLTIALWVERFDGRDRRRLGLRRLLRLRLGRLLARRGGLSHRRGLILAGVEVDDHDAHDNGGDDHETEHQPQERLARGREIAIVRTSTTG